MAGSKVLLLDYGDIFGVIGERYSRSARHSRRISAANFVAAALSTSIISGRFCLRGLGVQRENSMVGESDLFQQHFFQSDPWELPLALRI